MVSETMTEVSVARTGAVARASGDRSGLGRTTVIALCGLLVVTMAISMTTGASGASVWTILRSWFGLVPAGEIDAVRDYAVIYNIRLPRMILGILIGAALAVSGLLMQGLFRNRSPIPGWSVFRRARAWARSASSCWVPRHWRR